MFKSKNEKIAFAIVMIIVCAFSVWFNWLRPVKHEVKIAPMKWEQHYYVGENGSYCEGTVCHIAVHQDDGHVYRYIDLFKDWTDKEDVDRYYYLAPVGVEFEDIDKAVIWYYGEITDEINRYIVSDY